MMNIAYCTDENYAIPTMISIISLLENTPPATDKCLYTNELHIAEV